MEQQLRRVREVHLTDLVLVVAVLAFERVLLQLRNNSHEPADIAHMDTEWVRDIKEAFFEEGRCTVGDHAVTLHFSETKSTVASTAFYRLAGEDLRGATGARVDFVVDHMPQTLIVSRAEEDLGNEFATCMAIVHDFETAGLVALRAKDL